MTPVCNATPLIHLARIGRLDLLRLVLGRLWVPGAVIDEVAPRIGEPLDHAVNEGWIVVANPADIARFQALEAELGGSGEAAVIALALEQEEAVVIVDERAAWRACERLGLRRQGTVAVVLAAKAAGHIEAVRPLIDALSDGGFWLDDATRSRVLDLAGE